MSAQVIFSLARQIGMLPLTGTSNADHMKEDLESLSLKLSQEDVQTIEFLAG